MMRGLILVLYLLCFCCNLSQSRLHHQKHSSAVAVVVGAVYCETCFQDAMAKGSHYITGATVAVECAGGARPAFHKEVKTDKQGSFRVHLPFSVSKHVKEIEGCTVKLVKSSEPYCAVASTATSSLLRLRERKGGKHIYSAGFFTFKPLKQPGLCNQQPSVTKSQLNSLGDMLPPLPNTDIPGILNPDLPTLPPLPVAPLPVPVPMVPTSPGAPLLPNLPLPTPELPLPQPQLPGPLPPLPPFSGLPVSPAHHDTVKASKKGFVPVEDSKFFLTPIPPVFGAPSSGLPIPNPFNPPPLVQNPLQPPAPLIPNPFQPPQPPSLVPGLPNIPGLPSPSTTPTIPGLPTIPGIPAIPNIPGIPGLPVLTPPPPPPPSFLPPLPPLLPGFRFPGIPPAAKSTKMNP